MQTITYYSIMIMTIMMIIRNMLVPIGVTSQQQSFFLFCPWSLSWSWPSWPTITMNMLVPLGMKSQCQHFFFFIIIPCLLSQEYACANWSNKPATARKVYCSHLSGRRPSQVLFIVVFYAYCSHLSSRRPSWWRWWWPSS